METASFKEVTVDEGRYLISHQQVEMAWEIGIELTKIIGEPVAGMAAADKNNVGEGLAKAAKSMLSQIDPKSSMTLIRKILSSVEFQGMEGEPNKKLMLDANGIKLHFHGRMGTLIKLVGETIAFTHHDFFSAMKDGIAKMMAVAEE